jgi:hypothetical protein
VAATPKPHPIPVAFNPQAKTVVFDFVGPFRPSWDLGPRRRETELKRLKHPQKIGIRPGIAKAISTAPPVGVRAEARPCPDHCSWGAWPTTQTALDGDRSRAKKTALSTVGGLAMLTTRRFSDRPDCRRFAPAVSPQHREEFAHNRGLHGAHLQRGDSRLRILDLMSATEDQLSAEQSRQDKRTRFRRRLIVGLWILVLAVSMTGWLVALAWIAYLLVRRLVS